MSKIQLLRMLINQRLTAAAEEIFGAVERTIAEYEENVYLSNLEIDRQRKMLDVVLNPQIKLLRSDPEQPSLSVCKNEVPEQHHTAKERSPGVDQGDPLPPNIKEEPEGEQQLQWLEQEVDPKYSIFTDSPAVGEADKDLAPSWDHRDNDFFPCTSAGRRTPERDGQSFGVPDPNVCPRLLAEDGSEAGIGDGTMYREKDTPRYTPVRQRSKWMLAEKRGASARPPCLNSKTSDTSLPSKGSLSDHNHRNMGNNACKLCGKSFTKSSGLKRHMMIHTGEKPHKCSVCGKGFNQNIHLILHIRKHSGEKPFRCTICDKRLSRNSILKQHMKSHTAEKQFYMFPMQS